MKFEIDPNELTSEQRTHIVAFITNWPVNAVRQERIDQLKALATSVRMEQPTEEQRLDAEQREDLVDVPHMQAANLDVIFGSPTPTESAQTLGGVPSVPLDKEGLPWDSRIHASTKTFIADGTWKLRRGVDPAEVEKVKAQLKDLMAVPTVRNVAHEELVKVLSEGKTEIPTPPADIPLIPVHNTGHVDYDPVSRMPSPEIVAKMVSSVHIPPPAQKSHYLIDQPNAPVTLTDLIARMSAAIVASKMTQATVAEMCAKHGVSEFMLLSSRPDLLPLIDADMKAMGV